MKVVSPKQMAYFESMAIAEGSSDEEFMEEAGSGVALIVHEYVEKFLLDRHVILLCGKGNNGGDALVAGIHLLHLDYTVVAFMHQPPDLCSPLCQKAYDRFMREGGRLGKDLETEMNDHPNAIAVDGLFGTGFRGTVDDPYETTIELVNFTQIPVIAIDIPSGLEGETGKAEGPAIHAVETAFLGLPKTGFFLEKGWAHVGRLRFIDFGMPVEYIEQMTPDLMMLTVEMLLYSFPHIERSRHKYEAGYVVGLAGSPGYGGAAILSSWAALKSGAGIVRLLHPKDVLEELVVAPFELIKTACELSDTEEILNYLNSASAVFIGPGLGRSPDVLALLKGILPRIEKPTVLDADALYHLAQEWIQLPSQTVLTPHLGEMARLLHEERVETVSYEYLQKCHRFAEERGVTIVLKGAPTFILHPNDVIHVCPKGDPGMATAGAGDVLTGIIASFLAQGLSREDAASLGVFIHGLAGEHASDLYTPYCMTASDIITHLPDGFVMDEL